MAVEARGPGGGELSGCRGHDFHVEVKLVACQDASGDVVQMYERAGVWQFERAHHFPRRVLPEDAELFGAEA